MATSAPKQQETKQPKSKVITGAVRLSYPWLLADRKGKYGACVLVSKKDTKTVEALMAAQAAAKAAYVAKYNTPFPAGGNLPIKDGDKYFETGERGAEYKGHLFFNASSKEQPSVIDHENNEVIDPKLVYGGMNARVSVNFYPFVHPDGGKGVAAGLNNVKVLEGGERFGAARSSAEEDFADDYLE